MCQYRRSAPRTKYVVRAPAESPPKPSDPKARHWVPRPQGLEGSRDPVRLLGVQVAVGVHRDRDGRVPEMSLDSLRGMSL